MIIVGDSIREFVRRQIVTASGVSADHPKVTELVDVVIDLTYLCRDPVEKRGLCERRDRLIEEIREVAQRLGEEAN